MAEKQITLMAKRKILEDSRYKKFKQNFETADYYNLPFKSIEDELMLLHSTRPSRKLKDLKHSPGYIEHVLNAILTDLSNRSRFTEILVACINAEHRLKDGLQALTDYLQVEYATELSKWRTKDERKAFLSVVLRPFYRYLDQVQLMKTKLELIISDIDKAGYFLKDSIQALELISKPSRNL
jgi:hypothetical protein